MSVEATADMQTWTFIDRTGWGPGPRDAEPDKIEWRDEATGYPCGALRAEPSSGYCGGYIGVPKDHPVFGASYEPDRTGALDGHGRLTFAGTGHCHKEHGRYHTPLPGEDEVWWFGF